MSADKFTVTHSCAPDPDPGKVQAALEVWELALAEKAIADGPAPEPKPVLRIQVGPKRLPAKRKRAGGGKDRA